MFFKGEPGTSYQLKDHIAVGESDTKTIVLNADILKKITNLGEGEIL